MYFLDFQPFRYCRWLRMLKAKRHYLEYIPEAAHGSTTIELLVKNNNVSYQWRCPVSGLKR